MHCLFRSRFSPIHGIIIKIIIFCRIFSFKLKLVYSWYIVNSLTSSNWPRLCLLSSPYRFLMVSTTLWSFYYIILYLLYYFCSIITEIRLLYVFIRWLVWADSLCSNFHNWYTFFRPYIIVWLVYNLRRWGCVL